MRKHPNHIKQKATEEQKRKRREQEKEVVMIKAGGKIKKGRVQ